MKIGPIPSLIVARKKLAHAVYKHMVTFKGNGDFVSTGAEVDRCVANLEKAAVRNAIQRPRGKLSCPKSST